MPFQTYRRGWPHIRGRRRTWNQRSQAMTDHTVSRAESLGVANYVSGARQIASHWLKRRRLYRLQQLDDRMLNDIGLLREEVNASLEQPLTVDPVWAVSYTHLRAHETD